MSDRIYITTSIPYVNACPHVGFALELVQADIIARHHRLCGRETRLQTGTDEHAFKNVIAAERAGIPTRAFVDRNAAQFRRLSAALDISVDDFLRTTEPRHRRAVREFWHRLAPDDLEHRTYTGLYCVACEDFYRPEELVDGRCPEHDTEVSEVSEENVFFRLSRYAERLAALIRSGDLRIVPETRHREVLAFIERGLNDISVTRAAARSGGWGIRAPGHDDQVIYVWIDALINYLTGPGFGTCDGWTDWWAPRARTLHVIGKNVWKFHAIYWPALLLSAGLPLPDEIVIHGFLTADGRKIGKSLGNTVDPFEWIDRVGADGVRYYLVAGRSPFEDADVSADRLLETYEKVLANTLGNLVSRLLALGEKTGLVLDPVSPGEAPPGYHRAFEEYALDEALASVWAGFRALNREIDAVAPWGLPDPRARERVGAWLTRVADLARWLSPFLPGAAHRISEVLRPGPVRRRPPLFPRVAA